jgi:uncharacterized RmlC-like cupin family protein
MSTDFANPYYLRWIPRYKEAQDVSYVDADQLSARDFKRNYVLANTPCLIRGAAQAWPAMQRWPDTAYLKRTAGHDTVIVRQATMMEGDVTFTSPAKEAEKHRLGVQSVRGRGAHLRFDGYPYAIAPLLKTTFAHFVESASSASESELSEQFFLYSQALVTDGLRKLLDDVGQFRFLPVLPSMTNWYAHKHALFQYRNHITDWHYHITAEAILTQVSGVKEVLLLPPEPRTWAVLASIQHNSVYTYNADAHQYPEYAQLVPYRAVLRPGDSLYIPNYWWHLVATKGSTLGQSITVWFDSPWHLQWNLELPVVRQTIATILATVPRKQLAWVAPLIASGVAWGTIRRVLARCVARLK